MQPGQRQHRLDGRAGRVLAAQGAVEQRLVDVVLQRAVLAVEIPVLNRFGS
jgi:hypothetical protein